MATEMWPRRWNPPTPKDKRKTWDSGAARCCCSLAVDHYSFARAPSAASKLASLDNKFHLGNHAYMGEIKSNKFIHFLKHFSKEIFIALVLAVVAAIAIEIYKDYERQSVLENNKKLVAKIIVSDNDGNIICRGSGVFISPDGKLVTNYHVIEEVIEKSGKCYAKLSSGACFFYKRVISYSKKFDLAILEFDAKDIPFINLKKIHEIKTGDQVITIGSPMGLEASVSEGIISNPEIKDGDHEVIQFTAPISSGNSGGGLFNRKGDLLGVTTKTLVPHDSQNTTQNLNFAIPEKYIEQTMSDKGVEISKNSAPWYFSQGMIYKNNKEFKKAAECFKQSIDLDPEFAPAYINNSLIYYEMGDFESQLNILEEASNKVPDNAEILLYLAAAYEDTGEFEKALAEYKKAVKVKPSDKDALFNVCLLSIMLKKESQIDGYWTKLSELDKGLAAEIKLLMERINNQ
jgi:S1-C subfamily serine protease